MPLDKATLEANIKDRVSALDCTEVDMAAEIAKITAEEVDTYIKPLVDAFNSHTHSGVIVAVAGGGGAPAVGTPGSSAAPASTV